MLLASLTLFLVGCADDPTSPAVGTTPSPTVPTWTTDPGIPSTTDTPPGSTADTAPAPSTADTAAAPVPDIALVDQNPTSPTSGQEVSPRDHLQKVSGWYFTHAT